MSRVVIAGLGFFLLAGVVVFWRNAGQERASRANPKTSPAEAPSKPRARFRTPAPAGTMERQEPVADTRERAAAALAIRGTVVVVEQDGRRIEGESGTFQIDTDPYSGLSDIDVSEGTWRADVPAGASLSIGNLILGGRKAFAEPATIEARADGVVEVRCRWFAPAQLRVIGADDEDLDGVELAVDEYNVTWHEIAPFNLAQREAARQEVSPASPPLWIRAGRSPVEVPAQNAGLNNYWVRAADHAWARVSLAQGYGGKRVVRLVRSGVLVVRVVPWDGSSAAVCLHLYRAGEHALSWWPDESGVALIEGLPPGRFEVRACLAFAWWRDPRVIAVADVEIEPGVTKEVLLSGREAPPSQEDVPLAGTLEIDPAWHAPKQPFDLACGTALDITVEDEQRDIGDAATVRIEEAGRWSAGAVPPGRYCFTLGPWMWSQVIEVGPEGTTEARLVVPPPCQVEVRLVDAVTGNHIADDNDLRWRVRSPDVRRECSRERKRATCDTPGVWRFWAPLGIIDVGLYSDLFDADPIEVNLRPGTNRIKLKAVGNFVCDLKFNEGTMPVPVQEEFARGIKATPLDGAGGIKECGTGYPCRLRFTSAGRYRITFSALIEGYSPVEPVEVEIATATIPQVEIALRPAPLELD